MTKDSFYRLPLLAMISLQKNTLFEYIPQSHTELYSDTKPRSSDFTQIQLEQSYFCQCLSLMNSTSDINDIVYNSKTIMGIVCIKFFYYRILYH